MNTFTIIKTSQEDKSAMQKEGPIFGEIRIYLKVSGIDRIGINASFEHLIAPQVGKTGLQGAFRSGLAQSGYIADRTVFDHFHPRMLGS